MPRPIKISEKGSALTCAEHDSNIDALLDRRNHTGTQAAATIHDLKLTVMGWPEMLTLLSGNETLQQQLNDLRNEVFSPDGHVQQALNALEARLSSALSSEIARINALASALATQTARIDSQAQALQTERSRIDQLDSRLTANDIDNQALWMAMGGKDSRKLLLPEPIWKGEVPGRSNILFLQYDTITDLVFWAPPPSINGGWVGSYKFGTSDPGILDLGELKRR